MTMNLTWMFDPEPGATLFCLFAYHGRDRDDLPLSRLERWDGPGARGHRIVHRDHYANPRAVEYQVAMMAAAIARLTPETPADLVVDRALGETAARGLSGGFGRVDVADLADSRAWRDALPSRARDYDHVVLVFPDALGLGCEQAERRILRDRHDVIVINGRRRVFRMTSGYSARLDLHRWLARTRVAERMFGAAVRPLAATLAAWDRVSGRTA